MFHISLFFSQSARRFPLLPHVKIVKYDGYQQSLRIYHFRQGPLSTELNNQDTALTLREFLLESNWSSEGKAMVEVNIRTVHIVKLLKTQESPSSTNTFIFLDSFIFWIGSLFSALCGLTKAVDTHLMGRKTHTFIIIFNFDRIALSQIPSLYAIFIKM